MSVFAILGWLLIAVAIIIAAALVLPFGIKVEAAIGGSLSGHVKVQPFGKAGPWLAVWETGQTRPAAKKNKPVARRKSSRPATRLIRAGYRFVADVLALFRLRALVLDVKFGCEDPADTGQMFGIITPLLYGAQGLRHVRFHVEPVFGQKILEGRATLDVAIVPIALLVPALRFGRTLIGRAQG